MIDPLTRQPVETFGSGQAKSTLIPREEVEFPGKYPAGTIVVSTSERRLYYILVSVARASTGPGSTRLRRSASGRTGGPPPR
jgi:hypothetical protein